jgi:hypothetical protein
MKRSHLKLITLLITLILISLFIYFGLDIQSEVTETMRWNSAKFGMNTKSKIAGFGILLTFLIYLILNKKLKSDNTSE